MVSSAQEIIFTWIIIFAGGFILGYICSIWVHTRDKQELQKTMAMLVTLIWIMSIAASIARSDYSTSIFIHGIMGGAAGFLFKGEGGISIPITIGSGGKK